MPASCIRKRISNDWLSFVVGLEVRPRNQHGYSSMCRSTLSPYHWHLVVVVVDRFFGDGQGALLHLPPEQWNVGGTHLGNRLHICLYLKRGRFCALECALSVCFSLSLSLTFSPSLCFEMMFRNVQTHPVWTLGMQLWTCISKSRGNSFLKWFFHVSQTSYLLRAKFSVSWRSSVVSWKHKKISKKKYIIWTSPAFSAALHSEKEPQNSCHRQRQHNCIPHKSKQCLAFGLKLLSGRNLNQMH